MKKSLILINLLFVLSACTNEIANQTEKMSNTENTSDSSFAQAAGGVDVGNGFVMPIPGTQAVIQSTPDWQTKSDEDKIVLTGKGGSVIDAHKVKISDLVSPSPISLQKHLAEKFPDRKYRIIRINELEGVRADLELTKSEVKSDIYLISELKDFIHIESELKSSDIEVGEEILASVRIRYKGVAFPDGPTQTARIKYSDRQYYSFGGECYPYTDHNCHGVSVSFGRSEVRVGNAGLDSGRIVELGPDSEVPFDRIKIKGKYLVAPKAEIPLSDIYTVFNPKNPQPDKDSIELKEGYVYLIRSVSWPDEDVITKVRVESLEPEVVISYKNLVHVEIEELKRQVELMNQYTKEYEQPKSIGEVVLFNRATWNNYFYSSFNFKYSTSGNPYIVNNGWDLNYGSHTIDGVAFLSSHGEVSRMTDIGNRNLQELTLADFPNPNTPPYRYSAEPIVGHSYLIQNFAYDGSATYGAVKVLEIGPKQDWIRSQFRRVHLDSGVHFQEWISITSPATSSIVLNHSPSDPSLRFKIPLTDGQVIGYYQTPDKIDRLAFDDSRPYSNDQRGLYNLKNFPADQVTEKGIESLKGKFKDYLDVEAGDTVVMLIENYNTKAYAVASVISIGSYSVPKIVLSIRYIANYKAPYYEHWGE